MGKPTNYIVTHNFPNQEHYRKDTILYPQTHENSYRYLVGENEHGYIYMTEEQLKQYSYMYKQII